MPRLSIIIACASDHTEFEDTLAAVLQNRPAACEVLVVLPHVYHDPYNLGDEVRFIEAADAENILCLYNAGAAEAEGEILHLLAVGLSPAEGWTAAALEQFDDPDVGAVAPLVLSGDGEQIVSAGVDYRAGGSRSIRTAAPANTAAAGPVLGAGFYRTGVFRSLGGLEENVGLELADVDLANSMRAAGYHLCFEPNSVLRSSAAEGDDAPGTSFSQGLFAERLFLRSTRGAAWPLALVMHLARVATEFLSALPRLDAAAALVGRLTAWLHLGAIRRHRDVIRRAALGEGLYSPAEEKRSNGRGAEQGKSKTCRRVA